MVRSNFFIRPFFCLMLFILLTSVDFSYSDEGRAPVKVTNRTEHFLHVSVNDRTFTYLAPNGSIQTKVDTEAVTIYATYSPGQEMSGVFTESYSTVEHKKYSGGNFSCSNKKSGCSSKNSTGPSESRITVPVNVSIFPENLQ